MPRLAGKTSLTIYFYGNFILFLFFISLDKISFQKLLG